MNCAQLITAIAVVVLALPSSTWLAKGGRLEMTQVDVFGSKGWNSTDVAIYGVSLGTDREKAEKLLSRHHLILAERQVINGRYTENLIPCRAPSCSIYSDASQPVSDGMGFHFDSKGELQEIEIDGPEKAGTKSQWANTVCHLFHGETRRFFYGYTDVLRRAMFGREYSVTEVTPSYAGAERWFVYRYPGLGLVLHIRRFNNMSTPAKSGAYVDSIDFIPPARAAEPHAVGTEPHAENRESLKQFLRTFDTDHSTRYELTFADLNGSGTRQAIVYLLGDEWCGSDGCNMLVLTPTGDSWGIVANVKITNPPIYVLREKFNGWHSIGVSVQGGGIEHGYFAELRFNGKRHPQKPSTPPACQPRGKPMGKAVITSTKEFEMLWD